MKKLMKKSRKGFTLVELLIVIIILGALAATMMLNSGNAVANAKANTIITNMANIKNQAWIDYQDNAGFNTNYSDTVGAATFTIILSDDNEYVVKAVVGNDPEANAIKAALDKSDAISKFGDNDYRLSITGKMNSNSSGSGSGGTTGSNSNDNNG